MGLWGSEGLTFCASFSLIWYKIFPLRGTLQVSSVAVVIVLLRGHPGQSSSYYGSKGIGEFRGLLLRFWGFVLSTLQKEFLYPFSSWKVSKESRLQFQEGKSSPLFFVLLLLCELSRLKFECFLLPARVGERIFNY